MVMTQQHLDSNYFCFDWPNLSSVIVIFNLYSVLNFTEVSFTTTQTDARPLNTKIILIHTDLFYSDNQQYSSTSPLFCDTCLYLPIGLTTASLMCSFCLFFLSLEGPTLLLLHLTIILFKYFQDYFCQSSYSNQICNKFTVRFTYKTLVSYY